MFALLFTIPFLICFFWAACWGEAKGATSIRQSPTIYMFSIAIYCTAWSFYGNIGLASKQGIQPFALYIGATFGLLLLRPLIKRLITLKEKNHSTSLADVLSARFHRSSSLAALITIISLAGIIPYLTIQVISITQSSLFLSDALKLPETAIDESLALVLILLIATIAILFGIRKVDPTEQHTGMIAAIAVASVVKLFILVFAGFVLFQTFLPDMSNILNTLDTNYSKSDTTLSTQLIPPASDWFAMFTLGFFGILLLPRQFHVIVVECSNKQFIDKAAWQLPIYFIAINLFVLPVMLAGQYFLPDLAQRDLTLLALPAHFDMPLLMVLVYIGGFAAASCMMIISTMTLATMMSNHLLTPIIQRLPALRALKPYTLQLKWLSVFFVLISAWSYYQVIENNYLLIEIGTISFIAVLQFAPALVAGIYWHQATKQAAFWSITLGSLVWAYTSVLPTFIESNLINSQLLSDGPFGISALNPKEFFGLALNPLPHSLLWSLTVNIVVLVLVSSLSGQRSHHHANQFEPMDADDEQSDGIMELAAANDQINCIPTSEKSTLAITTLSEYMPNARAHELVDECLSQLKLKPCMKMPITQLALFESYLINKLAGVIGIAAASKALKASGLMRAEDREALSQYYSNVLARLHMPPVELLKKVSFHQERQRLLEDHSSQQQTIITRLEQEITQRRAAEQSLQILNDKLELRVEDRTQQLKTANTALTRAITELQQTQEHLIEVEKMASLGALVAGMAHEINTPAGNILTSSSGCLDELTLLSKELDENTLSKQKLTAHINCVIHYNTLVVNNVQRVISLIDNFKLLSTSSGSQDKVNMGVRQAISQAIADYQEELDEKQIKLTLTCSPELRVKTYQDSFILVIDGLISNSLQHGFKDAESGYIVIDCKLDGDKLNIDYRDTGRGMDPSELAQLFEPFYTTERYSGRFGLGGHIMYNLVTQRLNGHVHVESSPGRGVHYQISIPF